MTWTNLVSSTRSFQDLGDIFVVVVVAGEEQDCELDLDGIDDSELDDVR